MPVRVPRVSNDPGTGQGKQSSDSPKGKDPPRTARDALNQLVPTAWVRRPELGSSRPFSAEEGSCREGEGGTGESPLDLLWFVTTIVVWFNNMLDLRSHLRQELLRYYFTNPKAEHYLRELAELLQVDPANLSRELAELTRQGIFLSRTRGRQKHFQLNQDHPLYEEFRSIVLKTVGVIGELRKALAGLSGVADAYLFGSFAGDQQDPMSDIDVLIVGDIPGQEVEEKLGSLERKLHREINYTVMTPDEFRKRRAAKDPFLEDVFRHKRIDLLTA